MRFNFLRATYDFEKLYITNWQEMVFFYFFFFTRNENVIPLGNWS